MKALVVVAHPDDHVLWVGGTVIKFPKWEWHIISLCNSHNDDFSVKETAFIESCNKLKVSKSKAIELHDHSKPEEVSLQQIEKMKNEILNFADNSYDLVFTQSKNPNCEYSFHANHYEIREAVLNIINNSNIQTKALAFFSYKSGGSGKPVIADTSNADYTVQLTDDELQKKKELKQSFKWAEGDLRYLQVWDNFEPEIEAFNMELLSEILLPPEFLELKNAQN